MSIDIRRKIKEAKRIYLDTCVCGEIYEKTRLSRPEILVNFIDDHKLTVLSSPYIEYEIDMIPKKHLFEGIARTYLRLAKRKEFVHDDPVLSRAIVDVLGQDFRTDALHVSSSISGKADIFTSLNKQLLLRKRKKIKDFAQRLGYKLPFILQTDDIVRTICDIYGISA